MKGKKKQSGKEKRKKGKEEKGKEEKRKRGKKERRKRGKGKKNLIFDVELSILLILLWNPQRTSDDVNITINPS